MSKDDVNISDWWFEGKPVRVENIDGAPWFAAKDLRAIHGWPRGEEMTLPASERMSVMLAGECEPSTAVSELGMHILIAGSTQFKPFLLWALLEFHPRWLAATRAEAMGAAKSEAGGMRRDSKAVAHAVMADYFCNDDVDQACLARLRMLAKQFGGHECEHAAALLAVVASMLDLE
jgi:hypothetical protein